MTPSERLKEIEREWKMGSLSTKDSSWLIIRVKRLTEALEEVTLGRGRYSMDNFEHARNCIEDMKEVARKALEEE